MGYANNAQEDTNELETALHNFATASAADRSAFTQLNDTNSSLQQQLNIITQQNQNLQA